MREMLTEEQGMIRDVVREFAAGELGPLARDIDLEARFPREAWPKLAALDLLGLGLPAEAGGAGAGDVVFVVAVEEIARICGSTAAALVTHAAMGAGPIASAGDLAQRRRWLVPLLAGQGFATLAVSDTEIEGEDPAVTATRRGDGWALNGVCVAVPGAMHADVTVVSARIESGPDRGLFVVERDTPGLGVVPAASSLGLRGLGHGRVELRDVAVADDRRLGDADAARAALARAHESAWVGFAAVAVGLAEGALERALRYARERPQFDKLIVQHESVQWHLADAALDTHVARLAARAAARAGDAGTPARRLAAMAKIVATAAATRCGDRAIQVLGGYGYMTEFHVERYYRDAQACEIVGGTGDALRRLLVRELGREADGGWNLLQ
jgi:alkylation response protein AidB-like acyl-CoA dehydrogenase